MRRSAHRLLVTLLLTLIGIGYLAGAPGVLAQDNPVGGAGDGSYQLGFPFPVGESWGFVGPSVAPVTTTGAPEPALTYFKPRNPTYANASVAGGSIRAMRGGTVSLPCAGMVKINHGTFSTVYYPVASIAVTAGATVTGGQALGLTTAADIAGCPGAGSNGSAVVHVWIEAGGNTVSPVGMDIGGWTVQDSFNGYRDTCINRGDDQRCRVASGFEYPNYFDSVTNDGEFGSSPRPYASLKITGSPDRTIGSALFYELSAFPQSTSVTLEWRRPNGSTVPLGTRTTNVAGALQGRVIIPETSGGGENTLVARTSTTARYLSVEVNPTVQPGSGSPRLTSRGETVTVRGNGLPASTTLTVTAEFSSGPDVSITPSPTTDSLGNLSFTYTVPSSAPLGSLTFRLFSEPHNVTAFAYFTITSTPEISLSAQSARVGSQVTVSVTRFPANTDVVFAMDGTTLGTRRTNANGSAELAFTVPTTADSRGTNITATAGTLVRSIQLYVDPSFDIQTASTPPGGEATALVYGVQVDAQFLLEWNDGEVWREIGYFVVQPDHTITFPVPADAPPGGSIMVRLNDDRWVDELTITSRGTNTPPTANAGPDRKVGAPDSDGAPVTLNGSGSSDTTGSIVSYVWRKPSDQGGATVATGVSPTLTLRPGVNTFILTVKDNGGLIGQDTVVITVGYLPQASAPEDQTVADPQGNGESIAIDGSTYDQDGTITSIVWREGATTLATTEDFTRTFAAGVHTLTMTVTDNDGFTDTDSVVITVTPPQSPVARAGDDQTVHDADGGGETIFLDASASTDADDEIVSWVWKEGTTTLGSGQEISATLAPGVHTIVLTVTDNAGHTATDTVVVTVTGPPPPVTLSLSKESSKYNGSVVATLSGFAPNSDVSLRWPRLFAVTATGEPTTDLLATGRTDASGQARLVFRTPLEPFLASGYLVTARDATGKRATDTLRVIPRIMLNEEEGPATTRLRVYFYGFSPNERIEVRWHAGSTNASSHVVLKTLTVAANGRASSIVVIPRSAVVGTHLIVGKVVGVSRSASTPFTLTAGGGSVDDARTPTSTADPTATPDATATATPEPTEDPTATPEPTETPMPTATVTPEPTTTPEPTATPIPNASPVAAAGEDQTLTDVDGSDDELVQLDGTGSTDPEGGPVTYAWSVDGVVVSTDAMPTIAFPVGTTTVTLTVTDDQGATATDDLIVKVEQSAEPAVVLADPPTSEEPLVGTTPVGPTG